MRSVEVGTFATTWREGDHRDEGEVTQVVRRNKLGNASEVVIVFASRGGEGDHYTARQDGRFILKGVALRDGWRFGCTAFFPDITLKVTHVAPDGMVVELNDPSPFEDIVDSALDFDGTLGEISSDDCEVVTTEDKDGDLVHIVIIPGLGGRNRLYSRKVKRWKDGDERPPTQRWERVP